MSNTNTTRLGNADIINIAKQRFEKKQQSKLPSIIVNLPSGGAIYPKTHPLSSGQVEMRYMTAYDEDILTNTSYIRESVVFDKLLESLVVSDINIADIASIDKDALIINARIVAYGSDYPVIVTHNSNELKRSIDLRKIQPKPFNLVPDENGEFEYKTESGHILKFTYAIDVYTKTIVELLQHIITEVDGQRSPEQIDQFLRYEFFAGESRKFREYYTNNAPGLDLRCEFEGEDGSTFTSTFQLGTDLFWF